jgi:sugar phosphate isomerase/epimerase
VTAVPPASDERPYHENFEFARKRLTEIAEALAPHGVRIGVELDATAASREGRAFEFIHDFEALRQLAKASPDNVGVVVDPWQMQVAGAGLDAIKSLTNEEIVAAYLSDLPEGADLETVDETSRLLPGESGAIDAPAVLTALVELGYDGPVTPRAYRKALEEQSREAIVKLAGERLEAAWKGANLDENGQFVPAAVEEEVEEEVESK